jgi:hypothetical protein
MKGHEVGSLPLLQKVPRSLRAVERQEARQLASLRAAHGRIRRRLTWLVAFAQRMPDEFNKLPRGERESLAAEVVAFASLGGPSGPGGEQLPRLSAKDLVNMAATLREGIYRLVSGLPWKIPVVAPLTITLQVGRKKPVPREYSGNLNTRLCLTAADLLEREGFPPGRPARVRRCARTACQKLFVAVRRQIYCSGRCSLLERTRKFRSALSKEEMSRRRHEWYKRQVRRDRGPDIARHVRRRKENKKNEPSV